MTLKTLHAVTIGALALAFSASAHAQTATEIQGAPASVQVTTPDPLSAAAAVYATYHGDVTDIRENEFKSIDEIQQALSNLGSQNSEQLARGWLAYSALVASQNPEFRAAVRDLEGFYGQDTLVRGLQNDVRYARTLNGGNAAVSAALSASEADSERLQNTAEFVKEQAYSLQAYGWAKGTLGDSGGLATRLRADSMIGRTTRSEMTTALRTPDFDSVLTKAGRSGSASLWENITGAAKRIQIPKLASLTSHPERLQVAPGKEQVADKIATLAAYRILGTDGASAAPLQSMMTERETAGCLNMAQLNLQQCIAATHQHFEVPFCLGEHALADVGRCINKTSR